MYTCFVSVCSSPDGSLSLHFLYKDDLRDGSVGKIAAASASSGS